MEVKDVMWFSGSDKLVGIVVINNGFGNKAYIKSVKGDSENEDINDIIDYGTKLTPYHINRLSQLLNE